MNAVCLAIPTDTAATVELTCSSYNVSETEGVLQICASINMEVEVNVSVNIQSEDITAQGTCIILLYLLCNNRACDICKVCSGRVYLTQMVLVHLIWQNGFPLVLTKFKFGDLNTFRHRLTCIKSNWRIFN